jgi:hypothetical protein
MHSTHPLRLSVRLSTRAEPQNWRKEDFKFLVALLAEE